MSLCRLKVTTIPLLRKTYVGTCMLLCQSSGTSVSSIYVCPQHLAEGTRSRTQTWHVWSVQDSLSHLCSANNFRNTTIARQDDHTVSRDHQWSRSPGLSEEILLNATDCQTRPQQSRSPGLSDQILLVKQLLFLTF